MQSSQSRTTVILLATGPDRLVDRVIETASRHSGLDIDVVVGHDSGATVGPAKLQHFRHLGPTFVDIRGLSPGTARNQLVRATRTDLFVFFDGSDDIDGGYVEAARRELTTNPRADFAAARGELATFDAADGELTFSLGHLLGSPWAASAAVVRRVAFERVGGFDESIPDLAEWDLLITLAEAGSGGIVIPVDVRRFASDDIRMRESLRAMRHLPAVRKIFAKHQASFERHAARVLTDREKAARRLWSRERTLVAQRDQLRGELAETMAVAQRLQARLRAAGKDNIEFGDLRRIRPLSETWGFDRGKPIDRYYIETFVANNALDIRGTVLEVLNAELTTTYGRECVTRCDVVDIDPGNDKATIIADLRSAEQLASDRYDCVILTQTLHLIDDVPAVLKQIYRILKPGGVLLATMPSVSRLSTEYGDAGDFWRVTAQGARRLLETAFPADNLRIESRGNLFTTTAFLFGLACDEVAAELWQDDADYPLIVSVRAQKPASSVLAVAAEPTSAILLYHRVTSLPSDSYGMAVNPDEFREHLEQLVRTFHVIPLSELSDAIAAGDIPDRSVALTFDDGYLDNLEVVMPLLSEFGLPATFFLTSEKLLERRRYWWDILDRTLLASDTSKTFGVRLDGRVRQFSILNSEARQSVHDEIYAILKVAPQAVRDDVLRQLEETFGPAGLPETDRPLVLNEIRRLAAAPAVEIGAHSVHHLSLSRIGSDQLYREVFECRTALERAVGKPIEAFAYPFGDVSREAEEMVQSAGFRRAVTCEARNILPYERPFRLPRLQPPATGAEFQTWLDAVKSQRSEMPM